ncbi:MAG: EamA family transporter [Hyphomicrobiales bacterium]|nr:MAG: EamA family transporter [Hyphomicrobiales bacterium]
MTRASATLIGLLAIVMWSTLALFTAASGKVPPLQLVAMCLLVGGLLGMTRWPGHPGRIALAFGQSGAVYALGCAGLFGFHLFYFTALRHAPVIEASLISYLWPMLIVLFSALLPGERLGWHHLIGAALGLAGAVLIVTGGKAIAFRIEYLTGYLAALGAALSWSSYSVLSRRFAHVGVDVITVFCLASAALAAIAHLLLETTLWPQGPGQWLAVLGLGLGPVGGAFYVWDTGMKHGDIQFLGVSAYAAPLVSTLLLIVAGYAAFTWVVALAVVAMTVGALIAARDILLGHARMKSPRQTGTG